ncbi:hypothetical protein HMPREF9372_2351 [Sporosarcina newyorkensis 2681]|uniref:Uncharacterized protein n=1 Tax=Sporosarcina newyorkensis 2681 TaxID=1027292 RepID=F9DU70_9BACL|nr:hypothetical protein HMPREF9372_2351 [Sporosarcina newyorkensis 2681]
MHVGTTEESIEKLSLSYTGHPMLLQLVFNHYFPNSDAVVPEKD